MKDFSPASLLDLAGTKASVVQIPAEAKDYVDIDALLTVGNIDLPTALSAAQVLYGRTFNPEVTLKALSFFDDGNLHWIIRKYVTDEDILEALDNAPPGIIDPRSWAYWNLKMGRYPAPPLPMRRFFEVTDFDSRMPARQIPSFGSATRTDLEETRRLARETWSNLREGHSSKPDLEEVRRRARENWRNKYVDGK